MTLALHNSKTELSIGQWMILQFQAGSEESSIRGDREPLEVMVHVKNRLNPLPEAYLLRSRTLKNYIYAPLRGLFTPGITFTSWGLEGGDPPLFRQLSSEEATLAKCVQIITHTHARLPLVAAECIAEYYLMPNAINTNQEGSQRTVTSSSAQLPTQLLQGFLNVRKTVKAPPTLSSHKTLQELLMDSLQVSDLTSMVVDYLKERYEYDNSLVNQPSAAVLYRDFAKMLIAWKESRPGFEDDPKLLPDPQEEVATALRLAKETKSSGSIHKPSPAAPYVKISNVWKKDPSDFEDDPGSPFDPLTEAAMTLRVTKETKGGGSIYDAQEE